MVIIGIVIAIALALGAWIRLTIAVAHGDAAAQISSSTTASKARAAAIETVTVRTAKPTARAASDTSTRKSTRHSASATKATTRATTHATETSATAASPQQIAQSLLSSYGWDSSQWEALYQLWEQESGWSVTATNATSGAYGIAQANPASQMASTGSDYLTDATTQIKWGLGYIKERYGSPEAAWAHEEADGWY
jgi:resuscitation-promoting factor RpfB